MEKSILRKITKDALINWDYEHETEEEKERVAEEKLSKMENPKAGEPIENEVVYGSVESAIAGMKEILGLDGEIIARMRRDIVTAETMSPEVAQVIRNEISVDKILDILTLIHNGWVRENGNKFEARPKNYQFTHLELLPFQEAVADLLFVEPILEATSVKVNREELKRRFLERQQEFLRSHKIYSRDDLQKALETGSKFYSPLEGVATNKGNKQGEAFLITDLLQDKEIAEKMALQIEEKAKLVYPERKHDAREARVFAGDTESLKIEQMIVDDIHNEQNRGNDNRTKK